MIKIPVIVAAVMLGSHYGAASVPFKAQFQIVMLLVHEPQGEMGLTGMRLRNEKTIEIKETC